MCSHDLIQKVCNFLGSCSTSPHLSFEHVRAKRKALRSKRQGVADARYREPDLDGAKEASRKAGKHNKVCIEGPGATMAASARRRRLLSEWITR